MNANCDPILDMRLSQQQLKEMFERNKALAKANPKMIGPSGGWEPSAKQPVFLTGMTVRQPRSKYRNVKVEYEGMKFDSKHELKCWQELELRQIVGRISELNRQVRFDLEVNGVRTGKITVDFTWKENGQLVVADAKSEITRKERSYRMAKRHFEAQYAPLVIREL